MWESVCSDDGSWWRSVWEKLSLTPNDLTHIVNYDSWIYWRKSLLRCGISIQLRQMEK